MTSATTNRGRKSAPTITPAVTAKPMIDRFGGRHSEAVLRNWSPAALAAMGIRRADDGEGSR